MAIAAVVYGVLAGTCFFRRVLCGDKGFGFWFFLWPVACGLLPIPLVLAVTLTATGCHNDVLLTLPSSQTAPIMQFLSCIGGV